MKIRRLAIASLSAFLIALISSIPAGLAVTTIPSGNVLSVDTLNTSTSLTFSLSAPTTLDIGVADGFLIGDYYSVTLDGNPLFTTSVVPQASSITVCNETPAGNLASCAAAQAAGNTVQTGLGVVCTGDGFTDLAKAHSAGLSIGDAVVGLGTGSHTITVTDVSPVFTGSFDSFAPSSFCVDIHSPPSFGIPEFSGIGTMLVVAALIAVFALISIKKSRSVSSPKEGLALG